MMEMFLAILFSLALFAGYFAWVLVVSTLLVFVIACGTYLGNRWEDEYYEALEKKNVVEEVESNDES